MSEELLNTHAETSPAEAIVAENDLSDAFHEKAADESTNQEVEQKTEAVEQEEDQFSSKFAALSRRDKELRQKEKEIEAKLAEFEAKMQQLEESQNPAEPEKEPELPLEYRLKKDPINTLAELGLSVDKINELVLNDGKLTPDMQMELMRREIDEKYGSELENLRNELAEKEQKAEEQKYEQVINDFVADLTNFVNSDEKYEMIKANDAVNLVYNVIEEHHQQTGKVLSNQEAADQVEEYLFEEAKKLLESNKLKGLYQTEAKPVEQKQERQESPTLSNNLSTQVSTKGAGTLSDEESKAAIAKFLKWED